MANALISIVVTAGEESPSSLSFKDPVSSAERRDGVGERITGAGDTAGVAFPNKDANGLPNRDAPCDDTGRAAGLGGKLGFAGRGGRGNDGLDAGRLKVGYGCDRVNDAARGVGDPADVSTAEFGDGNLSKCGSGGSFENVC